MPFYQVEYREKGTLILTSLLEDLGEVSPPFLWARYEAHAAPPHGASHRAQAGGGHGQALFLLAHLENPKRAYARIGIHIHMYI